MKEKKEEERVSITDDIIRLFLFVYRCIRSLIRMLGEVISWILAHLRSFLGFGNHRILHFREHIHQHNVHREEQFQKEKQHRQFQDVLMGILYQEKHSHYVNAKIIVLFATFALQLISLTTTYRGARYYLLDLNPIAPFLFAVVVQLLLFYFSKEAGERRLKKKGRYVIFIVITCISILTSYVGIANATMAPLKDYKEQYAEYENVFTSSKADIKGLYGDYSSYERAIDAIQNDAAHLVSVTNNSIAALEEKSGTLQQIQPNTSTTISNQGGVTSTTQTVDQTQLAKALEKVANNREQATKLNQDMKNLKDAISQKKINALKKDLQTIDKTPGMVPSQESYKTMENVVLYHNTLLQTVNGFLEKAGQPTLKGMSDMKITLDDLVELVTSYRNFDTVQVKNISTLQKEYGILQSTSTEPLHIFDSMLRIFFPFENLNQEEYQKFRNAMELQITDSYYDLLSYADKVESLDKDKISSIRTSLKAAYEKNKSFTDISVIAFSRLTSPVTFHTAMICLILAALIDMLSAVLPFLWFRRSAPALRSRKHHRCKDEQLLEDLYYAAATALPLKKDDLVDEEAYTAYIYDVIQHLIHYFHHYHELPYMEDKGFVMYANREEVEQQGYLDINAVLNAHHLVTTMSSAEVEHKRQEFYQWIQEPDATDSYVYVMKKELLQWLHQVLYRLPQEHEFHRGAKK